MADAFALASAAAERRKAGAPRIGALPRPKHQRTATFAGVWRGMVGMRLSALRLPLLLPEANLFFVRGGRQSSDA
jgi:hypothetical protein